MTHVERDIAEGIERSRNLAVSLKNDMEKKIVSPDGPLLIRKRTTWITFSHRFAPLRLISNQLDGIRLKRYPECGSKFLLFLIFRGARRFVSMGSLKDRR
jgi:hypothetical protein